jgi:hypothetical protein
MGIPEALASSDKGVRTTDGGSGSIEPAKASCRAGADGSAADVRIENSEAA